MNRLYILFFCLLLMLLNAFPIWSEWSYTNQLVICISLIALLGIPHGAIDHVIFMEERETPLWKFYFWYVGSIIVYVLVWLWWPGFSLVLFLIISAYHFGQSQLSDIPSLKGLLGKFLALAWGTSVITALVVFNFHEIRLLMDCPGSEVLFAIFDLRLFTVLWVLSLALLLFGLAFSIARGLKWEDFFSEVLILGLIHACFYLFPILISFTFFFVVLHSLKVLAQEYSYLKELRSEFEIRTFLLSLAPYSLLSLFGIGMIYYLSTYNWIDVSDIVLAFILISVITLPHSFVMEWFYQKADLRRSRNGLI